MRSLFLCVVLFVAAVPPAAHAALRLELVARGLTAPVALVADPLLEGTFLIVQQDGLVRVWSGGILRDEPFLDLRDVVSRGGERGLLGLACPPDAGESRRVYVNFTDRDGDTVIARFLRSEDPFVADRQSRFDLQWPDGRRVIGQPYANHNGGNLAFGPDGFLYIGLGDGGAGNDPGNRAQSPDTLLGKMLRIDVNVPLEDPRGYAIPSENPFAGRGDVLPEIWAFGYRNPWRYGFDDLGEDASGALIVGDVGQDAREEIDYEPARAGGRNYGWRQREGTIATTGVPPEPVMFPPFVEPILDYGRGRGQAVTGGYVYRGAALPPFYRGRYFFGDFGSGRVWSVALSVDPETREATAIDEIEHTDELGGSLPGLSSFARDLSGELYLVTLGGDIYRVVAGEREEQGNGLDRHGRPPAGDPAANVP